MAWPFSAIHIGPHRAPRESRKPAQLEHLGRQGAHGDDARSRALDGGTRGA
jgi:hypothetical protein